MQVKAPEYTDKSSHLGPQRPWLHFSLKANEWNNIFPNIFPLSQEIWNAHADPTNFGWLNAPLKKPLLLEENKQAPQYETVREYEIDGFHWNWMYPYASQPESSHIVRSEEEVGFGIFPGVSYFDVWGGIGNVELPAQISETIAL